VTDATVCVTGAGGVADAPASGAPVGEPATGVVAAGGVVGGVATGGVADDAGATTDDSVEVTASTVFETGVVTAVSSEPTDASRPDPGRPDPGRPEPSGPAPATVPLVESEPDCAALEEGVAAPVSAAEADIAPNARPSTTKPPAAAAVQSSRRSSLLGGAGAMARSIDALPPMQTLV
jgi:hypothetical protein